MKKTTQIDVIYMTAKAKTRLGWQHGKRESELNVSLIAFEVGIESLSYFSKIFKAETGFSPIEYRAKYQSSPAYKLSVK